MTIQHPTTAGTLDPDFGLDGVVFIDVPGYEYCDIESIKAASDGRIYVAGHCYNRSGNISRYVLGRFHLDGTLDQTCHRVAGHLAPEGLLVCGFGTDADHLPAGCPVTDLDTFAAAARAAGLEEVARWGTWTGDPWSDTGGYVVLLLGLAG